MKMSGQILRRTPGLLLVAILLPACLLPIVAQETPGTTAVVETEASYVGTAPCKVCHAKVWEPWSGSAHGKALTQDSLPEELKGCEACHGPSSKHVGSPAQNKPSIPKADDPKNVAAVCGACHIQSEGSKAPKEWQTVSGAHYARTAHARNGVTCLSCHVGHSAGGNAALAKPTAADLCLSCHKGVLESSPGKAASYTHMPVAQGQCLTCHSPHGGPVRGMVVADVGKKCEQCHDPKEAKTSAAHKGYAIAGSKCEKCHDAHSHDRAAKLVAPGQHGPFKQGKCETCHTAPSPGQPAGLVKPANELCLSCHPASSIVKEGENAHLPAKQGLCTSCHNAHASTHKGLMKSRAAYACFSCHNKVEQATVASHRHKVVEKSLDCMMCHKPHGSVEKDLLAKDEMTLCRQCHKHSFSHPMGTKEDGSATIDPTTGGTMVCASCHYVHGSEHAMLTTADKARDLCVQCHTKLEH